MALRLDDGYDRYNAVFDQIQMWRHECDSTHDCKQITPGRGLIQTKSSIYPTRLIKVGSGDSAQICVQNKDAIDLQENGIPLYLALSYCWGENPKLFCLTEENEKDLRQKFMLKDLPKTIREAIIICRRVNVPYLWVDSLCIIQGGEGHLSDWNQEARHVGFYYNNADFTIAAAWSSHNDEGCLPPLPCDPKSEYFRSRVTNHDGGPLFKRGWVLQEVLLSSRIIFCHRFIPVWSCFSDGIRLPETKRPLRSRKYDLPYGFGHLAHHARRKPTIDWSDTVETYSALSFTIRTDMLSAISTVAQQIHQQRPNDTYLAGIWASSFVTDLCWCGFDLFSINEHGRIFMSNPKKLKFTGLLERHDYPESIYPTWSWASARGRIRILPITKITKCEDPIQLIKTDIFPMPGANIYGRVTGGSSLTLKVAIRDTLIINLREADAVNYYPRFSVLDGENEEMRTFVVDHGIVFENGQYYQLYEDETFRRLSPGKFKCALVFYNEHFPDEDSTNENITNDTTPIHYWYHVLILYQHLGETIHRRLGYFEYRLKGKSTAFPQSCVQEVTIV
jgi:hypothetical protein